MEDYMKMVNSSMAVITRPGSTAPFDAAKREASTAQTILGLVVWGVVAGLVALIQGGDFAGLVRTLIFTIVGFYIFSGILYVLAKVLGGTGDFTVQSYLLALVSVPLGIATSIVGLVPGVGGLVNLLITVYEIILYVFAIKSGHAFDTTKAAVVVLIPVVVFIVLAVLAGAAFLAVLFGTGLQGG